MAKIIQYPHYLFALKSGESTQDKDGNWIDADSVPEFVSMCREETDGRGSEVQVANGSFHRFSSLIQLPKGSPRVEAGVTVFVSNDKSGSDIRIKGTVLKFDVAQLHSRLWV